MSLKRLNHCALILLFGLALPAARADVVTLTDGSRLIGTVERLADGKIILVTEFAGTLEIEQDKIASIETDQPINVGMDSGDRLVGRINWNDTVEHAVVQTAMGGIPVDVERISDVWPRDGKSPEAVAMEQQVAAIREEAAARVGKWTATVEAGLLRKDGNTNSLNARGRAELRHQSTDDLLKFYLSGEYSEESEIRNTAEVKAGAYYEYLITERIFAYGSLDLEYDEFENLDLRAIVSAGGGYYWIKKPEHELNTRGGIGCKHESFMDGFVENTPQAVVGLDYRLDITSWMQFVNSTTWHPTFESVRDYRLVADTALLFPLGGSDIWKLKIGALYEYDPLPRPEFEPLDETYYANILLDIK